MNGSVRTTALQSTYNGFLYVRYSCLSALPWPCRHWYASVFNPKWRKIQPLTFIILQVEISCPQPPAVQSRRGEMQQRTRRRCRQSPSHLSNWSMKLRATEIVDALFTSTGHDFHGNHKSAFLLKLLDTDICPLRAPFPERKLKYIESAVPVEGQFPREFTG